MRIPNVLYHVMAVFIVCLTACKSLPQVTSTAMPIQHQLWTQLLQKHVSDNGLVDYQGFRQDSVALQKYLYLLSQHHPNNTNWTTEEQQSYWMNAYNAYTVDLIVRNYPVKSIKDISTGPTIPFVNSPWDIPFITIEGHRYDLNNIEHNILRTQFNDPRIHFGINCASISCPNLPQQAFEAATMNTQLDSLAHSFLADTSKNTISPDKLELSKIFWWFKSDFTKQGSMQAFLQQYTSTNINPKANISHRSYNWQLNEKK